MSATLSGNSRQRLNSSNSSGGRPTNLTITMIEGHVEEIIALRDDSALFRRSAIAEADLLRHIEVAHRDGKTSELLRATSAMRRLITEKIDRAARLISVIVPEVTACYTSLEAAYA